MNILDGAHELSYIALAIVLVWPLQMTTYIKVTVVSAYMFRLGCAALAALRGTWIGTYVHSSDPGLAIADVLVWQQVCIGYALISATIPTIKGFIRGYNKAMGFDDSSYAAKRRIGGGYNLESYAERSANPSASNSRMRSQLGGSRIRHESDPIELRPDEHDYQAGAYHEPIRSGKGVRRMNSSGSGNSEEPIIRRDISVTVEHEDIGVAA